MALRDAWFELKAAAEEPRADLRATVVRRAAERVDQAAATVAELVRPPDDRYFEDLPSRYTHVRRFLPSLLRLVTFDGTDAGKPVLAAWDFLRRQETHRPRPPWVDALYRPGFCSGSAGWVLCPPPLLPPSADHSSQALPTRGRRRAGWGAFDLRRRLASCVVLAPAVVPPVHPGKRRQLPGGDTAPRSLAVDQLGFVQGVHRLGQRVVVGIPLRADRGHRPLL